MQHRVGYYPWIETLPARVVRPAPLRCGPLWTAGAIGFIDWRIGVNNATSCGVCSWHYAQLGLT